MRLAMPVWPILLAHAAARPVLADLATGESAHWRRLAPGGTCPTTATKLAHRAEVRATTLPVFSPHFHVQRA